MARKKGKGFQSEAQRKAVMAILMGGAAIGAGLLLRKPAMNLARGLSKGYKASRVASRTAKKKALYAALRGKQRTALSEARIGSALNRFGKSGMVRARSRLEIPLSPRKATRVSARTFGVVRKAAKRQATLSNMVSDWLDEIDFVPEAKRLPHRTAIDEVAFMKTLRKVRSRKR